MNGVNNAKLPYALCSVCGDVLHANVNKTVLWDEWAKDGDVMDMCIEYVCCGKKHAVIRRYVQAWEQLVGVDDE